jgi:RNA polymerase sigma factor (sigma-70 family)
VTDWRDDSIGGEAGLPGDHVSEDADPAPLVPEQGGPSPVESAVSARAAADPAAAGPDIPHQGGRRLRPADAAPVSDADLIARVREGDDGAYEEIYRRHADAVRRYARGCCRDRHTAEDLTGEVFARTLQAIHGGSGPEVAVRAYLLTTVRRVAAAWARTARREHLVEDFAVFAVSAAGATAAEATTDAPADVRAMREADRTMMARAFRSLPERWQAVLWHTAVEEEPPSKVAPLLGLTANATSVLAHRAREGLRQAYLQAHVSETLTGQEGCARYADRLGAHARGALRLRADQELRAHLDECDRCRGAYVELVDVNSRLHAVLPVAFLGWWGAGYVAAALAAGAGAAAGAAGAGAGAAGAGSGAAAGGGAGPASAGSGAAGGGTGAASAGAGGAAAEGLGASAKAAVAAGVVVAAAGVALALTLPGGHGGHGRPDEDRAAPPRATAPRTPVTPGHPGNPPRSAPEPPAASPGRNTPAPDGPSVTVRATTPSPSADRTPVRGSQRPSSEPTPTPTSTPTTPVPTTPPPPPPPPPPPRVYDVSALDWTVTGRGTEPEVALGRSTWVWRRGGLDIDGVRYRDGVTTGAPSRVTIDLNRPCTSFTADVGVDDLALGLGRARFEVYGDGVRLYRSPELRGGRPAVPVSVNLSGYRTLRLVARPVSLLAPVNLADWADARITCR